MTIKSRTLARARGARFAVRSSTKVSTPFRSHARLDRILKRLARRPERFTEDAGRLCAALDARGTDLEISDPHSWRAATNSAHVTAENQFSSEVDSLRVMGREEELGLAMRIEFA